MEEDIETKRKTMKENTGERKAIKNKYKMERQERH